MVQFHIYNASYYYQLQFVGNQICLCIIYCRFNVCYEVYDSGVT